MEQPFEADLLERTPPFAFWRPTPVCLLAEMVHLVRRTPDLANLINNFIVVLVKYLILGFILAAMAASTVNHFWRGQTLGPSQVAVKWGRAEFDETKFKEGDESVRASMAYSLLQKKSKYVGLESPQIRKRLGDFDGFYFRDTFPTYLIHVAKDDKDSSWQLVFLLDNDFKVANIIVHKNCCDRD